jgi:hypothetical protein
MLHRQVFLPGNALRHLAEAVGSVYQRFVLTFRRRWGAGFRTPAIKVLRSSPLERQMMVDVFIQQSPPAQTAQSASASPPRCPILLPNIARQMYRFWFLCKKHYLCNRYFIYLKN